MKCPHCHADDLKVLESRDAGDGDAIRRRRVCQRCHHRFTTYERFERPNLAVIKKEGERELFDRNKLFAALHRSVGKLMSSNMAIEEIVSQVESQLYNMNESEVPSRVIGELILETLKQRNKVAYVRFASVYREFKTIDEYEDLLRQLRTRND